MKRIYYLLIILSLSCRDEVTPSELITEINYDRGTSYLADGRKITIEAVINPDATTDFRNVLFSTTAGQFEGQDENGYLKKAALKKDGVISAKATLVAPLTASTATISIEVEIPDKLGEYDRVENIVFAESEASQLVLTANAINVPNNFDGEVEITGKLTNAIGNGVNLKTEVELFDFLSDSSTRINGRFRDKNLESDAASQISFVYSPGSIAAGQTIFLVARVRSNPSVAAKIELEVNDN